MRYLLMLILVSFSAGAHAAQPLDCDGWKNKASQFMSWRQQGMPISEAVKDTPGNLSRGLLLRAYAEPIADDYESQFFAAKQFSETVYEECRASRQQQD
jgi:hypothetical protein